MVVESCHCCHCASLEKVCTHIYACHEQILSGIFSLIALNNNTVFMLCQAKTIAISSLVTSLRVPRERVGSGDETKQLALFPGSRAGEEEREPGTHCSRMRQVPLVTCIYYSATLKLMGILW